MREKGVGASMNILFVCTGNTCRSPLAEAIFNHLKTGDAFASSAGIFAFEGSEAAEHTIKVLEENKMKLDHRSKPVEEEMIKEADYVFTMTKGHKDVLMEKFPGAADKIFTLKEYVLGPDGDLDILDPFGGDLDTYRATFKELKGLIEQLPTKLD